MNKQNQRYEFTKLLLTGKYTQSEAAKMVKVTEATACKWKKESQPLMLMKIRTELTKELDQIVRLKNHDANKTRIDQLITDIARLESLILKAKYLPHVTQPRF